MDKATLVFEKYAAYGATLSDYISYGKDVIQHKYDVYKAGRELDVPRWTLIKHDIDKFLPISYKRYAEWFYGPEGLKGTKNPELKKKWRAKVREHYKRSPHHATKVNKKKNVVTELESLADWYSAHKRAIGHPKRFIPFKPWIKKRLDKFKIRPETKELLVQKLQNQK